MAQGTIKHVNPRGFGFLVPDDQPHDLFFHISALEDQVFDQLREGQRVEFEEATDPEQRHRRRATRVRPLADAQFMGDSRTLGTDSSLRSA